MLDVPEVYLNMHLTLDQKYPDGTLKFSSKILRDEVVSPVATKVSWANALAGRALRKFMFSNIRALEKAKSE